MMFIFFWSLILWYTIKKSKSVLIALVSFLILIGYIVLVRAVDATVKKRTVTAIDIEKDKNEPLETLNSFTFGFNSLIKGAIIDPLIDGY